MPAIKRRQTPEPGGEEDKGPYLLHGAKSILLPELVGKVPSKWIHINDERTLEAVVADGKPKRVVVVAGWVLDRSNNIAPEYFERIISKAMGPKATGFDVWASPDAFHEDFYKNNFRTMADLITNPKSLVGMALRRYPESALYYVPGTVPTTFKPNPLQRSKYIPEILGNATVVRQRRFNQHFGSVNMARLWEHEKGNYAVWADDSNTMYYDDAFHKKYGYPVNYGLKFYSHYPSALEDFLTRRTLGQPFVPGGE